MGNEITDELPADGDGQQDEDEVLDEQDELEIHHLMVNGDELEIDEID